MRDIQLILRLFASQRIIQRPIHQRAKAMFKDDRMWDVMVTHKAGAVQSTSHPICILSNLTQRGSVMRNLKQGRRQRYCKADECSLQETSFD